MEETFYEKENNIASEAIVEETEPITAERLKEETSIGGWLAFFLFVMMAGGILGVVQMLLEINRDIPVGSSFWFLQLSDILLSIMLLILACYTLISFTQRKPDAVFLAKTYVVAVFASGVFALIVELLSGGEAFETQNILSGSSTFDTRNQMVGGGVFDFKEIMRPLVWGLVWFLFLIFSSRVNTVIPKEYRRVGKKDWWIVGLLIGIPVLCASIGLLKLDQENTTHKTEETEFLKTVVLAEGEYTDGKIVFTCPPDFTCEKMQVDGLTFYSMENETQGIIIASDYDSDNSKESVNTYWKESTDDGIKGFRYSPIRDEKTMINGNMAFIKTGEYTSGYTMLDSEYCYRRFALIFNKESGKVCLVNCYDQGDDTYFDAFLQSIRFK